MSLTGDPDGPPIVLGCRLPISSRGCLPHKASCSR